ncbi:MAG: protein dehydratase [Acidimicrobiaceae bacterium]|nr:protein dehydratase [Acidimicrobiaceae bacterium]
MNIKEDDEIPSLNIPSVDPQKMKTMAALLRDPYPIHWDAEGNEKMGIKGKVVNQGPLNLSYLVNMLMNWQGQDCIRRLTVRFTGWVLGEDTLTAHGKVISIDNTNNELLAECEIWLERDGERLLEGKATVALTDN